VNADFIQACDENMDAIKIGQPHPNVISLQIK